MKKRYVTTLTEALSQDILQQGEHIEDALMFTFEYLLGVTSGVVYGLDVTQSDSDTISVAIGAMINYDYRYGELEAASGVTIDLPVTAGNHTYTVYARFEQVLDSASQGYKLIDTATRTETTVTVPRRKFGAVIIEVAEDTESTDINSQYVPLAELTVTTGGIQSVDTTVKRTFTVSPDITDGAITTDMLANDAVTSGKLADNAVDTAAIQDDAVTIAKAADEMLGYDVAGGCVSTPSASGYVLNFIAVRNFQIPSGAVGSYAKAQTAATAEATFTIYKNGVSIGTFVFAAAGTTATFNSFGSTVSFTAGDVLTIKAPGSADATLADIGITLKGILT